MALQTKDFSLSAKSQHGKITYTYIIRVTENSVDPVKNCSRVTIEAILQQTYSGTAFSGYRTGVSCTVDGETVFSDYCRRTIAGREEQVFYTWEGELPHETDGTRSIRVGGKLWQPTPAEYTPPTMNIPEGVMTLTPISRASRVGATDAAVGSASAVVMIPASEGLTHTLQYTFGRETGYICADGTTASQPERLHTTAVSFSIPESFYYEIPNKPWEDCILRCDTYLADACIGSSQTAFRVTAEESRCGPQLQWDLQDVNPDTLALTGDAGLLVRYMSDLQVSLYPQARYGAAIMRQQVGNKELSGQILEIPQVESGCISAVVEDSRGYVCRQEQTLPMIDYVKLTNNATVTRTAPTTGEALLRLAGNCYCGSFGAADNVLYLRYRLCPEGGTFTPWQEVIAQLRQDHTYEMEILLRELDYTKSYTLETVAADALDAAEQQLQLLPGVPVFHWKKDRFFFHVPVEFDGGLSGAYVRKHSLVGENTLVLRIELEQTVFLFGAGICGIAGSSGWWGSSQVTAQTDENGVQLTLPQGTTGDLLLISTRPVCIE